MNVYLTAEKYDGTIVIPEEFLTRGSYELTLMSKTRDDRTTIVGGIDLNNSRASVRDLDFIAPDCGSETKAIWNGCSSTVQNSSFQGYDVALDSSVNTINPRYCVFVGNAVAFDVRCEGTVYFYRNYYGEVKNNAPAMTASEILEALRAGGSEYIQKKPPVVSIADHSSTKVVTNPRWNDPVGLDAGVPSLPAAMQTRSARAVLMSAALSDTANGSANYLTADWELPTEIVSGEAGLELDAAAFAEASAEDRIISVVDKDGNVLGVWNFGTEAHPDLSGSFNAVFGITQREDGTLKLEINVADSLLSALQPRLTIPGASGGVEREGIAVDSENSGGGLSFTVSTGGDYEISNTEPDDPVEPDAPAFSDVAKGAWYYDSVAYVCAEGPMEGVSEDRFDPDGGMMRSMVWAILARADGQSVTGGAWAEDARRWALDSGVSDGENASGAVTREQLVTMLWRAAGEPEADCQLSAEDADEISPWAGEAMRWAVSQGIIEGGGGNRLNPGSPATRAQAAAILARFFRSAA